MLTRNFKAGNPGHIRKQGELSGELFLQVLIFTCFLANVIQTELQSSSAGLIPGSVADRTFNTLEARPRNKLNSRTHS